MKKIISLLTVFSIMLTLVVTVGVTPVSAATTNLYNWDYYNAEDGKLYTNLSNGTYGGKEFHIKAGLEDASTVTYYESMTNVSDDPFLNIISEQFICNYNAAVDVTKPVINYSFKMYIPTDDLKITRNVYLSLAKKDADGNFTNNTYGTVYLTLTSSSGNVYGGAGTNAANISRKSIAVTGDTWHQMNLRVFTHEEGKITYGMYMDGILFVVCESTAADISFEDIGIRQLYFNTTANTYIKDISLSTEDFDTLFVADGDALYYSNVNFDTPHTIVASTKGFQSTDNGTAKVTYQTSTQSTKTHYYTGSVYQNVAYDNENGTMKITLTPSDSGNANHATIQNFNKKLTTYFPADTTKYMQMSYDVKVASGSEEATRSQIWRFGNNADTTTAVYGIGSKMVNNEVSFYQEGTYQGVDTRKSITLDVDSDKWYRVIELLEITNRGSNYLITSEGYVMDLEADTTYKLYEAYTEVPKATVVDEAITDGFKITQARTDVYTPKDTDKKAVVTYYDNIASRIWDEDFSAYYPNMNDLVEPVKITVNNKSVTATGLALGSNGTQKIIIAGYNTNGKLVKMVISDSENATIDATKGTVSYTYDFTEFDEVKTVKAFMIDGITTAKPLGRHAVAELK